jgi:SAM-dependent methyltransferase
MTSPDNQPDNPSDSHEYFATRMAPNAARAEVWRHVAKYLSKWINPNGALLDLAAGYGDLTGAVNASRRVAIDIHPDLATLVPSNVEAHVGDATDLSRFADGEFATVSASNFLEHLDDESITRCLSEAMRVLQPGGLLILIQPNYRLSAKTYFDDPTHVTIFDDKSLAECVVKNGFTHVRTEARFLPMTLKSRLSSGHKLVPLYLRLPWRPLAGQMLLIARKP